MLLRQDMHIDRDTRKITLRNTVDCSAAIDLASEYSKDVSSNKEFYCMGYIPPEFWNFDPWLKTARKHLAEGDKGQYFKYIKKFFNVHTSFKNLHRPKTFYLGGDSL